MPDSRSHRGPDPRDRAAFEHAALPRLRAAVADLSWLLSRGYAELSALKLVGDRLSLTERQRSAVRRCACSDAALANRTARRLTLDRLRGRAIAIDGFNVLTTVEAALGGAVVLVGRDGSYRDLLGVHGTYRKVEETCQALALIGELLEAHGAAPAHWLLDSPVSNSGRLAGLIRETAGERGWGWNVELVFNPDPVLIESANAVATADSGILDRCGPWVALARAVIGSLESSVFLVDLSDEPTD